MARERPINAEVPRSEAEAPPSESPTPAAPAPKPPSGSRFRRPVPLPLRLVAGAIAIAAVFIVAAILGGGGDGPGGGTAPPLGGEEQPQHQEQGRVPQQLPGFEDLTAELGYPGFATKNTTRVGGEDPAAIAAGVSLAVFPSTTPGRRPAAVTVVDEESPATAIAAAVLMAAPVGAPVLVSSGDGMPEVSSDALAALDPQGSGATHGAEVFAIGDAAAPGGSATTRVEGGGAATVAARIARLRERLAGSPPRHLVIAPAASPAFAAPAAAWAARSGDPVLFAARDRIPKATVAALRRNPKVPAYVLGPSSAISSDVLRGIAALGHPVRRVAGEDAVANSIALARYEDGGFGWNVNDPGHGFVVARSDAPLDAAAASPLSASGTWGPLLLTDDAATLPSALRGYLLDVKPGYTEDPTRAFYNHVWVIGDQEAIEVGQQAEIDSLAELAKIGGPR